MFSVLQHFSYILAVMFTSANKKKKICKDHLYLKKEEGFFLNAF